MSDIRVQLIRSSRLRFGEAPRSFVTTTRQYLHIKRPFLTFGIARQLKSIYENHQFLFEHGHVVWAVLVVASTDLFEKGQHDGRGVVVYSPQLHLHDELLRLVSVADKVGEQRTRQTSNSDETELFNRINNNKSWFAPQVVPTTLSEDDSILTSSILCVRKHLPRGILVGNCFPIITHPDVESIVLLPDLFWPEDLRATWTDNN